MNFITLNNVCMSYEGYKVIDNLSFSVRKGDYLCIVGENGTGKTTLLKGLLGLKKLDSGELKYCDGFKSNEIGYLPQQTELQRDFPASVREVVRSGKINRMGLRVFYSSKDKKKADEVMEKLEIKDIAKKCYHDLSGGQQQRVLLARAICASEKLLILDEPVSGLDASAAEEMYDTIDKLNREGMTVIMISHDIKRVLRSARSVLHLGHSEALFYGNCEGYKNFARKAGLWEKSI